jgi:hypothetical protein
MLLGAIGTTIICAVAGPHGAAAEPAPIRATGFLVGADGLLLTAAQTVGNAQSALVTCPGQPGDGERGASRARPGSGRADPAAQTDCHT